MNENDNTRQDHMVEINRSIAEIWQTNTTMMSDLLNQSYQKVTQSPDPTEGLDPLNIGPAFKSAARIMASDPMKLMQANNELWKEHVDLMQQLMKLNDATLDSSTHV